MIGVDANVLIRYLVQDDPLQSAQATEFFEQRLSLDETGFISTVVLAETAWVLQRSYRWNGPELASILERLLQADVLVIEHEQPVADAVRSLKRGAGSFADALIGALANKAGCSHTVTFDKGALRIAGFKPV